MQLLIIWFFFSDAASLFKGSLPAMNVALVLLLFAFIKLYGAGPQLSRRAAANADVMSVHGHTAASPPRPRGAETGFYTRPCWLELSAWPFSKACFPSLPVLLSCTSLTSSRRWTCLPRMDNRTSIFFTEFGKRWPLLFCLHSSSFVSQLCCVSGSLLRFYQIRAGLKVSPRVPHRLIVTTHDNTGNHWCLHWCHMFPMTFTIPVRL